jgi:predicted lipid-binding transport protein (Tim44 family)
MVIAVTKAPSTSWEIVVGSAFLLAGAAVALVVSRSKGFAPLKEKMELYGRFGAYIGALIAYIGVLAELGSSLRTLGFITAAALIIILLALLVASIALRHRARFDEQADVQEPPEPQAEGSQQAMRRVSTDGQEAGAPEEVAVDGGAPEPSGR